jgi:poly(A) polymerase
LTSSVELPHNIILACSRYYPITQSPDSNPQSPLATSLKIISRAEHGISRQNLSPNCLKVLYALNEAGFDAYIVGGGVRDVLLGMQPKDFDVATNATPEEIRSVFRNSRIIGRRFRIVHVHFGREIIEVSTFRAQTSDKVEIIEGKLGRRDQHIDAAQSSTGMILRDNVYGSMEEDVLRRDFTVNALYYTVRNFEVWDYVDGLADIDRRCLRMIGDPEQRYREDPVRVLRAIRLAAKLDFSIAPETETPLKPCAHLLTSIPAARLFDEFMKLFFHGRGLATWELLEHHEVFRILFPCTGKAFTGDDEYMRKFLASAFHSTDTRINEGLSVTPAFLLAAILWPAVRHEMETMVKSGMPAVPAMLEAGQSILTNQLDRISIPRRFSIPMREIWEMQLKLQRRHGRRAEIMLAHKRFRAAYDFLLLREEAGEQLDGLGQWWTEYQAANPDQQAALRQALEPGSPRAKGRRRRVKSRRRNDTQNPASSE